MNLLFIIVLIMAEVPLLQGTNLKDTYNNDFSNIKLTAKDLIIPV